MNENTTPKELLSWVEITDKNKEETFKSIDVFKLYTVKLEHSLKDLSGSYIKTYFDNVSAILLPIADYKNNKVIIQKANMKTVNQHETIHRQPKESGWYDTDKGNLFWWAQDFIWSCSNDKISEEYPKVWYEDADLTSIIAANQDNNKWVSVEERLPEYEGLYLIFNEEGQDTLYFIKDGVFANKFTYLTEEYGDTRFKYITHWQPLPPNPTKQN